MSDEVCLSLALALTLDGETRSRSWRGTGRRAPAAQVSGDVRLRIGRGSLPADRRCPRARPVDALPVALRSRGEEAGPEPLGRVPFGALAPVLPAHRSGRGGAA